MLICAISLPPRMFGPWSRHSSCLIRRTMSAYLHSLGGDGSHRFLLRSAPFNGTVASASYQALTWSGLWCRYKYLFMFGSCSTGTR